MTDKLVTLAEAEKLLATARKALKPEPPFDHKDSALVDKQAAEGASLAWWMTTISLSRSLGFPEWLPPETRDPRSLIDSGFIVQDGEMWKRASA